MDITALRGLVEDVVIHVSSQNTNNVSSLKS